MPKGCFEKVLVQDPQAEAICPHNVYQLQPMNVEDYVCLTSQNTQQVPIMYFGYKAFASHGGQVVFNTYSVMIQGKSLRRSPKPVSDVYLLCNLGHVV